MSQRAIVAPLIVMILISLVTTEGCDDRATEIAHQAADRQAAQNETMAQLQGEVAAGTKRLVEEEGKARQQSFELHRELQAERSQLGQGWDDLETERQLLARQRRTDSFLAALVTGGGGALAGLLALAFAWLTMYGLGQRDDSAQIASEFLIEELVAERFEFGPGVLPALANTGRLSISAADDGAFASPALPPPTNHPN